MPGWDVVTCPCGWPWECYPVAVTQVALATSLPEAEAVVSEALVVAEAVPLAEAVPVEAGK